MKCVVLAYHNIGRAGIEALRKNGFEISAVFTHQDNPDENIWFGSVAELAGEYDIPVFAPESVNHPVWVNRIRAMKPDYIFSFYYRDMLGGEILSIPSKGAINLHGSLLPKYRGRVPLNWAIINGETEAGVTLHYMTRKADAGDIISQEKFAITDDDTAKTVFDKAAEAAKVLLDRETGRENVDRYGDEAEFGTPLDNPYVLKLLRLLGFDTVEEFLEQSDIFIRHF